MSVALDNRFVYGVMVPAFGILYGFSLQFELPVLSRVLLFALVATASFGWLLTSNCSPRGRSGRVESTPGPVIGSGGIQDRVPADRSGQARHI